PDEFKKGQKKIQLFQAVFEKCHGVISIRKSKEISRIISTGNESYDWLVPAPYNRQVLARDLRVFSILSSKLTSVQQILDKVSNLPELPDLYELLEPPVEEAEVILTEFTD